MAWLESVNNYLPPMLQAGLLAAVIALLTVGLAWGIRPAIQFLLGWMGSTRSQFAATLLQALILLGGMILIVIAVGVYALVWVITVSAALLVGVRIGRKHMGAAPMKPGLFHSPPAAQGNAAAAQNSSIMTHANAVTVLDLTVADATAHFTNDADGTELATTESVVAQHGLPATPIAQSAESVPAGRKLIQHAAAVPLTRRRGLGKRTVRGLR